MAKLYLLDILVTKVIFDKTPVPLKKDIIVQATCPKVGSLEIRTDVMGALENLEAKERSSKKKDVDIDCGRSILFPMDGVIMDVIKDDTLEVTVSSKQNPTPLGTLELRWPKEFADMVASSLKTSGYLTPVILEDQFEMTREGGSVTLIDLNIKLSYLGHSMYTNYQKMAPKQAGSGAPEEPAKYLFKSTDSATIFKCSRYGMGNDEDVMPVAAVYNVNNQRTVRQVDRVNRSTETLLTIQKTTSSMTSIVPSVFFGMNMNNRTAMIQNMLSSGSSTMSIRSTDALKGKKYMDLTELHMDVSTFSMLASAMGMHIYQGSQGEGEEGEGSGEFQPLYVDYKALTVAEIEERLCKHPDCPAAKMFKEFGIGPLAKNITGLGGLYNDVQAPCVYGLSHCNGTIDDYGPLGRFKRPKKAEEPFVPQSDCKCARKKSSTTSTVSTGSNTATRGKSSCYDRCPMNPMKMKAAKNAKPLRLRGGAPPSPECDPPPNPITMCQDLMEEFNKVLKGYKDALGPCGQATCPFAINVIGDACADVCNSSDPEHRRNICNLASPQAATIEEQDEFTGCGVPKCPYKRAAISPAEREFSKYKGMPGCGFTKCPFVKAKLGMEPDENDHLPAFKDYQKQETYKYHDALPPIHWDCPDPLPKGDCKNPDCPFVKRDALIKKYFPDPCCPCGSPVCPYVCAPCSFPGCPFAIAEPCPPVCPYTEPAPKELKCTASICPFVRNTEARCKNPECPYRQYEEKVAECAAWERQQAILAEQEAEEEEEPCRPCGRGKSVRARCGKASNASTSRLLSMTKTSGSDFASKADEPCSAPCVLSKAADPLDSKDLPCKPGTCGVGDKVCLACKTKTPEKKSLHVPSSQKAASTSERTSRNSRELVGSAARKESSVTFEKGLVSPQKPKSVAVPSSGILKKGATNKTMKGKGTAALKGTKTKNVYAAKPKGIVMGPLGPHMCRKLKNFTFDRKSYKPCTKIGHRECVLPRFLVPKCMGWLWNIHEDVCGLRPRRGWKPGAVSKMIAFRMDYFNALREHRPFGQRGHKDRRLPGKPSHPTLLIHKEGGVVDVTMHPLKEPAEVHKIGDGNPYVDCTPIQFKITKNNPEKEAKYCFCGDELSDTESSQLDIEFSPPAALKNPRLMHKQPLIEEEVQYNINDVPLPEKKKKGGAGLWTGVVKNLCALCKGIADHHREELSLVLRLRGGGASASAPSDKACGADDPPEVSAETSLQSVPNQGYTSLYPFCFWRYIIAWRSLENSFSLRMLFITLNINIVEELPDEEPCADHLEHIPPILRLRGGGDEGPGHDVSLSVCDVLQDSDFGSTNSQEVATLRLRGGSPVRKLPRPLMPKASELCKELMADYDKLMVNYKKALGPCGTATCPMNYNVLEEECRKVCQVTCPQPYCPPKTGPCEKPLCPHLPDYSYGEDYGEDEADLDEYRACYESCVAERPDGTPAVPCGRTVCPFSKKGADLCPTVECPPLEDCNVSTCTTPVQPCVLRDPLKMQVKCNKHICPYKKDELTIDDVTTFHRKVKPRKGCGSPFCPHSNKYQIEPEVTMPPFPCKRPCPSMDDLPPIHWDCPDPLPQGECSNPFCPLREKLPCGHCPIDARHCGMPGCQFAGDSLCPPTCPYTQKNPPKDLECRPSVCPLVRPPGYTSPEIVSRKDKPCGDRCPYATGIKKKTCGNPECPYATCIDSNPLMQKQDDCGNPVCRYKAAAKKRAQKEKEREEARANTEMETMYISPPTASPRSHSASSKTTQPTVTVATDDTGRASAGKQRLTTKKSVRMSTHDIQKLMRTSMRLLKNVAAQEPSDPEACRELTCAQYMGNRLCKKCAQRQREAQAAGTDLMALSAKNAANRSKSPGRRKTKKKARGYVYHKGTYYPGVKFGHRDCDRRAKRVPWDMGWSWNIHQPYDPLKQRRGWRPGAIGKTMLKFINHERKKLGMPPRRMLRDPLPRKQFARDESDFELRRRSMSRLSHTRLAKPKPTLTIRKKDGVVYVKMNPLKDPIDMEANEYPYIDCTPLEFKISKRKQDGDALKCACGGVAAAAAADSEPSSELDIEFTPPAGIVRPEMAKKQHVCHTEAQYNPKDCPAEKKKKKAKGKGKGGKGGKGKKGKKGKKKAKK